MTSVSSNVRSRNPAGFGVTPVTMSDIKTTVQADATKVEAAGKAELTKLEAGTYSFKTVSITAIVAFVLGLLVHFL